MNYKMFLRTLFFTLTIFFINATGASSQPAVPKNNFHLYLLVGQSNMAGRGEIQQEDNTPHPRVLMLSKENRWQPAVEPLHFDKPDIVGTGPGLHSQKKWRQLIAMS